MKRHLLIAISLLALAVGTASAQVDLSPGVARVSLINGDVSSQRGDTGDWAAAALNQPVVAGDSISTGDRSKTELQLDHANILRLGNNSQARVATLTRTQVQVQVSRGLAYYSVFKDSDAEIEIDTPNVAIRPTSKEGVYRIEVNSGDTQVIVRKGAADISTPQGSTRLEKGQSAVVRGTADEAEYKLMNAPSKDSWDSWNSERDGAIRNAQSWGHTNQYYVGSEDLDAYGRWVNVPDYGLVWSPVASVGWAPYRAGRWVWEPYWGWTWVSYEPWGWAPYHYGRWFMWNSGWYWWPGPVYPHYRPIWAPAYVSFFGFGGHWGVGFGFGSIGWLPIGPCDHYYPWWGHHRSRFNVVNVTNITNITNVQRGAMAPLRSGNKFSNLRQATTDMRVREAISTVPTEQFATGRVAPKPVSHEAFRDGKLVAGNLPLVPTKDNLSATNRPASATTFAPGTGQKRFFTRNQPAEPQSFDREAAQVQRAIDRNPRFASETRGGAQGDVKGAATVPSGDAKREAQAGRSESPAAQRGGKDGWQRFDKNEAAPSQPARTIDRGYGDARPAAPTGTRSEAPRPEPPASQERYGWHKFSRQDGAQSENRNSGQTNRPESREFRQATPVNEPPARSETPRERGDGWQKFTPQSNSADRPREERSGGSSERWTPATSSGEGRGAGYSRANENRERDAGASSRPPLNLRQPIVTPRSGGGGSAASGASHGGGGSHGSGGGGGAKSGSSGGGGSKSSGGGGQSHNRR